MSSDIDVSLPVCACHRSPATANKDVCSQLSEAQQAALKNAVEMGQQFAANPTSPVIWEHLTSLVEQVNAAVCVLPAQLIVWCDSPLLQISG
jgi:hypothetical protein